MAERQLNDLFPRALFNPTG